MFFLICAKRKDLGRYLGISSSLDSAIRFLQSTDLSQLQMGRNEIDGDQAFVNRFNYDTMPEEKSIWEGHVQYADIHVLLSGFERIGVTHKDALKETVRKPQEDFVGFEGPVNAWLKMTPEDFLIVFPEDVHMVKVIDGESTPVEKACFKCKV